MLERFLGSDSQFNTAWEDLGHGAPTIGALAHLCSRAFSEAPLAESPLSVEAQAILYLARRRGVIQIRGDNQAFDSVDRFLAIYVETNPEVFVGLRCPGQPQQAVRFLEGFRDMCCQRLVVHQMYHEFSLTSSGFERAKMIEESSIAEMLTFVTES